MSAKKKSKKKKSTKGKRTFSLIIIVLLLIIAAIAVAYFSWEKDIDKFNTEYTQKIETELGELSYSVMGEGPIVLVIHGEGTGLTDILKYKEIAEAGYKIICPSRPGYPGTSIELGKTYVQQSDLLLSFLDALGIYQSVVVVAESLGGPVALTFCSRNPGRVKALITIDALSSALKDADEYKRRSSISITGCTHPTQLNNFLTYYYAKARPAKVFQNILEKQSSMTAMECKKVAVNATVHEDEKDKFFTYLKTTMPSSRRQSGIENDISQATSFEPLKLWNITIPVFVFQTEISTLIPQINGTNLSKAVLNGDIYTYKGNGSMYWFGREWEDIKIRMLSFIKINLSTSKQETGLFSTWISMEDGTMLTLKKEGKFVVEFPSVEETKTWSGHFTVNEDRILFYFTGNDKLCKSQMGEYAIRFPEDKLVLIEKRDKCKTRKKTMAGAWFRL